MSYTHSAAPAVRIQHLVLTIVRQSVGIQNNAGHTIFDFLDKFSTNWLLPLVSIGVCLYVGWFAPKNLLRDQLSNCGTIRSRTTGIVLFIIRYIAPLLIAAIVIFPLL